MLYLVLGLLVVGIGQISAMSEDVQKLANLLHTQCKNETNVSEGAISDARLGIFAEDMKLKCYIRCVMVTAALMDENGRFNVDAILSLVPEPYRNLVKPILDKCQFVTGVDMCDLAFQANKCVQSNGPAYYYLP